MPDHNLFPTFKSSAPLQAGLYYSRKNRLRRIAADHPAIVPNTFFDVATLGPGITLSGKNLVVTYDGSSGADSGAKGLAASARSSGKVYFEMKLTGDLVGDSAFGICTPTSTYPNLGNNATEGALVYFGGGGQVFINGSHPGNIGAALQGGDWVGIAVDFDAHKIWFINITQGGSWNGNNADPTSGISSFTIPSGVSYVPVLNLNNGTAGVGTANFGDTHSVGVVPTGFGPWEKSS